MTTHEPTANPPATQNLVSIVTPVYNSEAFLAETIEGVLAQTWSEWELLLVDDHSTDGSLEVARAYAARDPRITVIALDHTQGPAVARNRAIDAARGRYIAFCDSDDVWLSTKLEQQLAHAATCDAAVIFTSYFKMEEDGTRDTSRLVEARPHVNYAMICGSNYIGCSTALYDTKRCGKVRMPNILKRQDYGLWLTILGKGFTAAGVREPLVYYRVRKSSVSSNKLKAARYHWRVLRQCTDESLFSSLLLFSQYAWKGWRKHRI